MRDPNLPIINLDGTWNLDGYSLEELERLDAMSLTLRPDEELQRRIRIERAKRELLDPGMRMSS